MSVSLRFRSDLSLISSVLGEDVRTAHGCHHLSSVIYWKIPPLQRKLMSPNPNETLYLEFSASLFLTVIFSPLVPVILLMRKKTA